MNKNCIWIGILIIAHLCTNTYGQVEQKPLHQGDFMIPGGGITLFEVRDRGVSPLFYDGTLYYGGINWHYENPNWSYEVSGGFATGILSRSVLESYASRVYSINHSFGVWRRIGSPQEQGLGYKAGLHYLGLTNIRNTPDFLNAGFTAESMNSLMASGEVEWLFKSDKAERKLLWLIPLKPGYRVSRLSWRLNLPLLNSVWGPRFPYLDDFTEGEVDYDKKNELKFGGLRLNSEVKFQYFLKNGNGIQLSYLWDLFQGPKDFGRIEWARHQFSAGVIIRFNEL